MKVLISSILIFILSTSVIAQWEWQNPLPSGNQINAVVFLESVTGIAVGDCGEILRTTNSGKKWVSNNINNCKNLNSLFFIDSDTGFIVGARGLILKTINAGQTWYNIISGTSESLNTVCFSNPDTGFIGGNNGLVLHSYDGGENWSGSIISDTEVNDFNDIYFINSMVGFACHYGKVFKTTNGGNTWSDTLIYDYWYDISFVDDSTGFIAGSGGNLLVTHNQGKNWTKVHFATYANFKSIFFTDYLQGYLTGGNTTLKTTDGGNEWSFVLPPVPATSLQTQFFFDESRGMVAGEGGRIFNTTNGGIDWSVYFQSDINSLLKSILLIDNLTLFLVQETGLQGHETGNVYNSLDRGITWTLKFTPTKNLYSMSFPSDSVGYVCSFGNIYKTTDSGETWDSVANVPRCYSLDFVSEQLGIIVGNESQIYKTTDGGSYWKLVNPANSSFGMTSIDMIDSTYGCAVGYISRTYYTINGGESWNLVDLYPPEVQFLKVKFWDRYLGFATGYYGEIFKSTNGGQSWVQKTSPVITSLLDFQFVNRDTIYMVGKEGVILKSTNAGEEWHIRKTITNNNLLALCLLDSTEIIAVGDNGTIITKKGLITNVSERSESVSGFSIYNLSQNFPNPFNPVTYLRFTIGEMKFVSLKIYDILGREIKILVNEEKPAGNYEVEFDASNLPSGIYFYRLKAGDFIETKKMVLLH